jgi:cell division protein FtsB
MNKGIITLILLVFLGLIIVQAFRLNNERLKLEEGLAKISPRIESLEQKNKDLKSDLRYFAEPENLLKEFKSEFNYKNPGERMIIVVPPRQ